VGLSERYVQMLMGRIRLQCLSIGTSGYWSREIRNPVLAINSRCIRVHGYTPAEILLGFNPSISRRVDNGLEEWVKRDQATDEPGIGVGLNEETIHGYIDSREERGLQAGGKLARRQDQLEPKQTAGYKRPKPGDLVLVRDFQQAKDKGRKLNARWSMPRILERMSHSGVSAHVRQLHDPPGVTKRFHLDDLLLFVSRDRQANRAEFEEGSVGSVQYSRDAMGEVTGIWSEGQRGFDLTDIG